MNIRSLTTGLRYRGKVKGKKQTYYIFEGRKYFLVMSFSPTKVNAGNFNLVDVKTAAAVRQRFSGQQNLTSKQLAQHPRKPKSIGDTLQALNVLYVLVTTGGAKLDSRFTKSKELHFNIAQS
jgi:hypothetical protein